MTFERKVGLGESPFQRLQDEEIGITAVNSTGVLRSSNLSLYVERRLIDELQPTESRCHWVARRILQVLGSVLASIGKLSFVVISLDLAAGNVALGAALVYGNLVSFACLICWSALNMINDYMQPVGAEVKAITNSRQPLWVRGCILVAAVAIGIFAQVPLAYLAYHYNSLAVLMAVSVMISDPWFPIYSTHLSLKALAEQRFYSPFEKEILQVKKDFSAKLSQSQGHLAQIPFDIRSGWIENLRAIAIQEKSSARTEGYLKSLLTKRISIVSRPPNCVYKVCEKVIFAFGLVFLTCQMIALGVVGFAGWKLIFDNQVFDWVFTIFVVLANVYLSGATIPYAAVQLFSMVIGILTCSFEPSLVQKLAPITSLLLTAGGLVTTGLSWGPSVQIVKDYFSGWEQSVMMATVPASNVLLVTAAILFVIQGVTEEGLLRWGSEDEKEQMKLKHKFSDFSAVLDKCSIEDFARFLKTLPSDVLDMISDKAADVASRIDTEFVFSRETSPLIVD